MNAISTIYKDLTQEALIKIFQLADILGVTPKVAAETYLKFRASQSNDQTSAA